METQVTFNYLLRATVTPLRCNLFSVGEFETVPVIANQGYLSVDARWYNITSTIAVQQVAKDASTGYYVCSVCTDRGTPAEACNDATLILFIPGALPILLKSTDNGIILSLTVVAKSMVTRGWACMFM